MITENRHVIFQPKVTITKQDLEDIPALRQLRDSIDYWEKRIKTSAGKEAYTIKRTLIDLRKDQYIIKNSYRGPIVPNKITRSPFSLPIEENFMGFSEKGTPLFKGVSLTDPKTCSAILCNYSALKQDSWDQFNGDIWYLMQDFDTCCDQALRSNALYERIAECKIDGLSSQEIQAIIKKEFNKDYTTETISQIWRHKIPKEIASAAEDNWLYWYYTHHGNIEENFKTCNRCGQTKIRHPKYFTVNRTSKDGFYSLCKECRRRKYLKRQEGDENNGKS